jgi:nitrogen fixation NifU-like protein
MKLENMYQEIILDHYKRPHGKGLAEQFDAEVHHVNPTCGDEITLRVSRGADGKIVVSYDNMGCSISQASFESGEAAVEHLIAMLQRTVEADEDILGDGIALAGVAQYPARVKCALLAWMAWKDAAIQAGADNNNESKISTESNKEQN